MEQGSETDYRKLDDPEFLAERARVRELLESTPEESADRDDLDRIYAAMDDEFIRRARHAWTAAAPRRGAS